MLKHVVKSLMTPAPDLLPPDIPVPADLLGTAKAVPVPPVAKWDNPNCGLGIPGCNCLIQFKANQPAVPESNPHSDLPFSPPTPQIAVDRLGSYGVAGWIADMNVEQLGDTLLLFLERNKQKHVKLLREALQIADKYVQPEFLNNAEHLWMEYSPPAVCQEEAGPTPGCNCKWCTDACVPSNPCGEIAAPETEGTAYHAPDGRTPEQHADLMQQMSKLQLMTGGQISQTTGLKDIGLDFREVQQRLTEDQRFQAAEQVKLQAELTLCDQTTQQLHQDAVDAFNTAVTVLSPPNVVDIHDPSVLDDAFDSIVGGVAVGHLTPNEQMAIKDMQKIVAFCEAMDVDAHHPAVTTLEPPDVVVAPLPVDPVAESFKDSEEQFLGRMLSQLTSGGTIHFETGPGYDYGELLRLVMAKWFEVGPEWAPSYHYATTSENADVNRRRFKHVWFLVLGQQFDEGKITRDYTDYRYRRIMPPVVDVDATVAAADVENKEATAIESGGFGFDAADLTDEPVNVNTLAGELATFLSCRDATREEVFAGKVMPPLEIKNDELDRSIPHPPYAWREGATGLVTVDVSWYSQRQLDHMSPSYWDSISKVLKVLTVPAYKSAEPNYVGMKMTRRSQEEMQEEIDRLNLAAGW